MEAMRAITERPPPRLFDMVGEGGKKKKWSPHFEDFVAQCLTKEPHERPTGKYLLSHTLAYLFSSLRFLCSNDAVIASFCFEC